MDMSAGSGRTPHAIEVRDYTFRYAGAEQDVLSNLSLTIDYGEFVVLSGESGAGKSTLIASLIGSIPHIYAGGRSGAIYVDGHNITDARIAERARLIGSVLQDADSQILHSRVEDEIAFGCENLGVPPEDIGRRIRGAAGFMQLDADAFTRTLSGGQKQRLITASALAMERRILLLDEPLANLDSEGAAFLLTSLRSIAQKGGAVLLAEHRLGAALPYADRHIRLEGGACANGEMPQAAGREGEAKQSNQAPPPASPYAAYPITPPDDAVFILNNVSYRAGGRAILRDLSLFIRRGERVVILGENGCGKTTLLRMLARLIRPTGGELEQRIDPGAGRRASPRWFGKVGYVYQNPSYQLFMPTVLEEIAYKAQSAEEAKRYADLFGLGHLLGRHPHSLSEGQKRRLSIAAVCATQPAVLLLDEPTVGQDHESLGRVVEALDFINKEYGTTLVTVTHDSRCAGELADRTLHLPSNMIPGS